MNMLTQKTNGHWLAYGLSLLLTLACLMSAKAQTPTNLGGWTPNNITFFASDATHIYLGGHFNTIIKEGVSGTFNNGTGLQTIGTGEVITGFPKVEGGIFVSIPDGSGGWYIGGSFTKVAGVTRNRIAHINSDKSLDMTWNPDANSNIYSVALSGTDLYVGGLFTTIGGQTRNRIAKLSTTTGLADATWNPNANGNIDALAPSGTDLYVGGSFTSIGGQTRNNIAKLSTTTGLADATWNPGAGSTVKTFALSGTDLYVGGFFFSIGGQTRNGIAKLSTTTGLVDATWNPDANSYVNTITLSGTDLYAGGNFTSIGGQARNRIAKLSTTTGLADATWNPDANGLVNALASSGTDLYVGGDFRTIGGQTRNRIAKLSTTTGLADATWNPDANNSVYTCTLSGTDLYVGGNFNAIGGIKRNRIARIQKSNMELDMTWNPDANDQVFAVALSGTDLYVGGNFTSVGGQTRNRIAKLSTTTGLADATWNPNANGLVRIFTLSGTDLYAGGDFTTIGGQTRNRIAKLSTTTGLVDATWNPDANNGVNAITLSGTDLYVCGNFTTIGGQTRNRIAKLSTTTGLADATWNPDADNGVSAIILSGTDLYVSGSFTSIGGQTRNRIAKLSTTTGLADATWNPNANSGVFTIALLNTDLYAGGDFTSIGGQQSNNSSIADGSTAYSTTNNTDFWKININTASARTFTIQNTGAGTLNISSITSSNAKFVVSGAPTTVSAGSSATCLLTYTPDAVMVDNTTLTINSDDADEAVYNIAIRGEGIPAYTWTGVGAAGFSGGSIDYTNLVFHPTTGEPYVAYNDGNNGNKATVMRYTSGTWTAVGVAGFSVAQAYYQNMKFQPITNEPYIAYADFGSSGKTTVMRFDGTNWVTVGTAGFGQGFSSGLSLAFHPITNEPYMAYRNGNTGKAMVVRFDGMDWVAVGAAGFSAGAVSYTTLAFDPTTNQLYIAYADGNAGYKATVMRYDGTSWINVGTAGFSTGQSDFHNLAFHPVTNEPYVTYNDVNNGQKTTVMRYNGTAWVAVGGVASVANASYQSFAFHPITHEPHIANMDGSTSNKATVVRYNGVAWVNVGTAGFSAGQTEFHKLAFHPTTFEPYVLYRDMSNGNKTTVMRFALPPAEINLTGNNTNIAKGANSPTNTDHTLFVSTAVNGNNTRIYTIQNTDTGALSITNVIIGGTDASLFTVSGLPAFPFNINGNSSQTFTVTFAPTSTGTKDAIITITNSDTDEASYDFAIRGVGVILTTFASPTGNDSNDGLTIGTPKLTIANALATVGEGGTVNIATGTYLETVMITKDITFATTGTATVQNLTINGVGKTLTLSAPLQVSRVVALQNGTVASNGNLIIASTATESGLIDNFTAGYTGTITGNIQVQRYLNNTNAGTRIFSAPVSGMTASQLASDVYTYNESIVVGNIDNGWQSTAGTTSLIPFIGYRVLQTATGNQTYTFVGTPNSGTYTAPLTRQVANGSNTAAGYTAVGNPYPSPINWVAVTALPANSGQITGIASIYKTTGLATGVWATVNSGGVGINGATRWIPSGEGFLVRRTLAGTSTYNITNSVRSNVYTNNNNFLREEEKTLVRLQLTNGTFADETILYAEKEATGKIDIGLDAEKLVGEADKPYIALIDKQQDWAITTLPTLPTGLAMPIAIRGNGIYTLQVKEKTVLKEDLYLYDRKAGKLHDLVEGYTFQAVGAENNRFVLYVGKPTDKQLAQAGEAVRVWSYDKTIYLHFADADLAYQAQVQVLNAQGQKVLDRQAFQDANTQLQTTLPTGVYIVRVQTPKNTITTKVIIE
ncbi:MAG: choice-of-anchor D domain-containing protein [Bacteroidetes bacterium]|nr:MAG: choice-of-anchor D domain-containing protein [Bacteroidota bacterium]